MNIKYFTHQIKFKTIKTKKFIFRTLLAMLVMAVTVPAITGCEKDDPNVTPSDTTAQGGDNPTPTPPPAPGDNYVTYNGVTYNATVLLHNEDDGMDALAVVFGDGNAMTFAKMGGSIETGTYNVGDYTAAISGGLLCMITMNGSEDPVFITGSLSVTHDGNHYTLDLTSTEASMHYDGDAIGNDNPTGVGTMTYGGQSTDIQFAFRTSTTEAGIAFEAMVFEAEEAEVTIVTANAFTSGTYNLVYVGDDDVTPLLTPNTAGCLISIEDDDDYVDITLTSGTVTVDIDANTYTVSATGVDSNGTQASLNYSGELPLLDYYKK